MSNIYCLQLIRRALELSTFCIFRQFYRGANVPLPLFQCKERKREITGVVLSFTPAWPARINTAPQISRTSLELYTEHGETNMTVALLLHTVVYFFVLLRK